MQSVITFSGLRRSILAAGLATAGLAAGYAPAAHAAATYPDKPVRLVVPYAPGGATDVIGRVIAQQLSTHLGQQFIVENRAGAGGSIGAGQVAKSTPDGYTLLLGAFTSHTINAALTPQTTPFDIANSFSYVSLVGTVPLVFVTHPSVPATSLTELIALAKSKPDSLSFASAGTGSPQHLATEMFQKQTGTKVLHVPYKGSGPALTDLVGGQVQVMIDTVPAAQAQIKAGNLRALGTTTAERVASLPDTPTAGETGLPDFYVSSMFALAAPADTPADVISRLSGALEKILNEQEVKDSLLAQGAIAAYTTPEETSKAIINEYEKWATLIKESNISVE
ncbi:Bug family tripartite tricarboxylate transporter substrate binding protein [Paracandidimonas soli]|uniref:Tripartite-type tricarboxylate transporter receptor subunit TctC n=1 Tax=Paracandidimonas soli TaxID=1917182 RepID=A0A4R3VAH3_9BURK|nr:tripartite tricarboxylate transporter substrate binding protein [Paracandidimonas soli]TCV00574.1 tripartite-type tricarboxylate transporter receptor subunit TctC [Paracandidimonas soli]